MSQPQPPYPQIQLMPLYKSQMRGYHWNIFLDNSSCHFKYELPEDRQHVLVVEVSLIPGTVPFRKQAVGISYGTEWKPLVTESLSHLLQFDFTLTSDHLMGGGLSEESIWCCRMGTAFQDFKKIHTPALVGMAQLLGTLSRAPEGRGFDSQSGHISRLWVWSLAGASMGGN